LPRGADCLLLRSSRIGGDLLLHGGRSGLCGGFGSLLLCSPEGFPLILSTGPFPRPIPTDLPRILAARLLLRLPGIPLGFPLILTTRPLLGLPGTPLGLLLILTTRPLLGLPDTPLGLPPILAAGPSLCRRRVVPAELPPNMRQSRLVAADVSQLRFVARDMPQLSPVTVAGPAHMGPAHMGPMSDDCSTGSPDRGPGPERTSRLGGVRGDCHR
jgi:hypothetical protein